MSLENVFGYFRQYDRATFNVVACQGSEPSEEDIAEFERDVGLQLPDEFRQFTMSGLGGLYMEVHESLWPRPKPYDVGPFWSFLYGLKVFGIAADIPSWLDIRVQAKQFRAHEPALVPFLGVVGNADRYCFDRDGKIVNWHHDGGECDPVSLSFSALLMREIEELSERFARKARGDDKPKP